MTTAADDLRLKLLAAALILLSSAAGVSLPLLLSRRRRPLPHAAAPVLPLARAFAAGVILATGFVHILPDAIESLDDPSLSGTLWSDFPFSGFAAMLAALVTLAVDFAGTRLYEGSKEPIVGVHAHSAERHDVDAGDFSRSRHAVVSQVLELGIASHSVIIGISLGVSHNPSTIRPLVAALSFHQFFEGFSLGGCISQAGFQSAKEMLMACFFTVTTPGGIGIGMAAAAAYDPASPAAAVVQGMMESVSAGILIYMALVDLIAADFLEHGGSSFARVSSYAALFLGAGFMSLLATWA